MEPGAAIVKNAGVLVANVLDIVERDDVDFKIAILDMAWDHAALKRDRFNRRAASENKKDAPASDVIGGQAAVREDGLELQNVFIKALGASQIVDIESRFKHSIQAGHLFLPGSRLEPQMFVQSHAIIPLLGFPKNASHVGDKQLYFGHRDGEFARRYLISTMHGAFTYKSDGEHPLESELPEIELTLEQKLIGDDGKILTP